MQAILDMPTAVTDSPYPVDGAADFDKPQQPQEGFSRDQQRKMTQTFKMMADPTRLKIVMMLMQDGEINVTTLCDRLNQSQPAVSHHLALMKASDLLDVRRQGKHNFYFVNRDHFHWIMGSLFRFISQESHGMVAAKNA